MRFLLIFFFILVAFINVDAQETLEVIYPRRIEPGLFFNLQAGNLNNEDIGIFESNGLAYSAGFCISVPLARRLNFYSDIHIQHAALRQRYNLFRWPSDTENGEWLPGRSHEEYRVKYLATGLAAGIDLALSETKNYFSITGGGIGRYVIAAEDELEINESGLIHDLGDEAINGEVDPLQYFLFAGMNYNLRFQKGHRIAISIAFEYSLNDLLKDEPEHLLFTYEGGHPFFTGIKVGFYL